MALGGCTIGLLMSILIPLAKRIAGNASLHSSLLKSNSHADLFMSGVQPSQLVDGITRCILSLPFGPGLVLRPFLPTCLARAFLSVK